MLPEALGGERPARIGPITMTSVLASRPGTASQVRYGPKPSFLHIPLHPRGRVRPFRALLAGPMPQKTNAQFELQERRNKVGIPS